MFWGLVLEPLKRYTQKVQQSFHISQAALELTTSDLEPIQIILEYDGANYVLATLSKKNNVYQVPLDLNFNVGDVISLRTIGKGRVHLTGYHILEDAFEGMLNGEEESEVELVAEATSKLQNSHTEKLDKKRKKPESKKNQSNKKSKLSTNALEEDSDDDMDGDFGDSLMGESDDEDEEEEEEEVEEEEEDEEEDEEGGEEAEDGELEMEVDEEGSDEDLEEEEEYIFETPEDDEELQFRKKRSVSKSKADSSINGKTPKSKAAHESAKSTPKSGKKSPAKEAKESQSPKSDKKTPKKKGKEDGNKSANATPQKKVLEGGVVVEELKLGDGTVAKPGKMLQVYYVGRLQSTKKQFDAATNGPGFKFRLGKGEVIKGWDIGVNGMKVGGKRRITIPSQLAYGAKGAPPTIPPNSSLVFEVELLNVN